MTVTLKELVAKLDALGYPVAFSHFDPDDGDPPGLPFITYFTPENDSEFADNQTYYETQLVDIELYTRNKDFTAESAVESMLKVNRIPYEASQAWIESEKVFRKLYEMRLF